MMRIGKRRVWLLLPFAALCAFVALPGAPAQPPAKFAGPLDAAAPQTELQVVERVNAAIDRGLEYIHSKQRKDGGWHNNNAINGLATLAFLGRGHVPGRGKYPDVLEKSKQFMLASANPQTGFVSFSTMYEHGLATLALAELYGMDPDPDLEDKLRKAVALIEKTQSPAGGWRYSPTPDNQDLSVTVMQIVALRAASNAEIPVSPKVIEKAVAYVRRCGAPTGGYGYEGPGAGPQTTAAGVLSLQLLGQFNDPNIPKSMDVLRGYLKKDAKEQWESSGVQYFYYFHYYAMQAHYQFGGKHWNEWHPRVRDTLLERQNKDGSWDVPPGTAEGASIDPNKVYTTGMACLVLDIYLHFLPAYQR
jgi:hypothetical protein